MKNYLVDSNIFLRIFIQDNLKQTAEALKYIKLAKENKINIHVLSEIIPELEYVLHKVYKVSRNDITEKLLLVVGAAYLDVEKREIWKKTIDMYAGCNIDLIDIFLYVNKINKNMKVLSFDADFNKLDKYAKNS